MSDMGHTALPWFAEYATGYIFSRPHPLTRFVIASTESGSEAEQRVNAAYIVTACNALPILVEALKPFARIADMEEGAEPSASVMVNVSRCRDARAALASIKGGDNA